MLNIRPLAAAASLALAVAAVNPTPARAGDGDAIAAGIATMFGIAALATLAHDAHRSGYAYGHHPGHYGGHYGPHPTWGHPPVHRQVYVNRYRDCDRDHWGRVVCTDYRRTVYDGGPYGYGW